MPSIQENFQKYESGIEKMRHGGGFIPSLGADVASIAADVAGTAINLPGQLTGHGPNVDITAAQQNAAADAAAVSPSPSPSPATGTGGTGKTGKAPAAAAVNPWEALTKQLTDQYSALLTEYQPTASGANQASMDKTISSQAEAMLGQGAGSPMAAWLDRTSGAAQAQGAGVTNAMANQANAAQTGAQGIQSSLTSMGKAETQQMAMAPYDQLLQALAGEVPYLLVKGNLPASNPVVANAPPALNWIENQFGVTNAKPKAGAASVGGLPSPAAAAGTSAVPVQPTTTPGTNSPMGG